MKFTLALGTILALGVPLCGQADHHVQPIPNWKEPETTSTRMLFGQAHICVIVEDNGADYSYVEGAIPGATTPPKEFTDSDIHKTIAAGGWVKILKRGYSKDDLARERKGCLEGSTMTVLPPAKKP